MSDIEFDTALLTAALRLAADEGWGRVTVAAASRAAGLPIVEARARFPGRASILARFGRIADQAALLDAPSEGPVRDRLFDLLMRRFDALQAHREGILAVLRALPADPSSTVLLACANRTSMRWMLQAAGLAATGLRGELQVSGLMAVWLWGVRAWQRDESEDLSGTMAVVDAALGRADQMASWLGGGGRPAVPPPPPAAGGAGELDPSDPPPPNPQPPPAGGGAGELDPSHPPSREEPAPLVELPPAEGGEEEFDPSHPS